MKKNSPIQQLRGKVILKDVNVENKRIRIRMNESFRCKQDEKHHLNNTSLLKLNIGLVTCFPIDCMHSV